ncbi:hypothetical protein [Anatilimnocola floriformis]|uniref:hypothetical protein n=1 Tax=Anatilimnocola floriformis TaxID=2948575 RepID=UPI0020C207DF|nr:hypothetical protein [Anatilimnocola floriformis]
MYHYLSRSAHSSDGIRYSRSVGGQVGAQWLSTPEEIGGALSAACQVFLCCMSVLQNQIGFGEAGEKTVDEIATEYLKGFPAVK